MGYVCGDCTYSSCDVTCGPGKETGAKHCVLLGTDGSILAEKEVADCPQLDCNVTCPTDDVTAPEERVTTAATTEEIAAPTGDPCKYVN